MKKLRVGLVGCGYIAPTHLLAWENTTGVKVTAVCDNHIERVKYLAEKFGINVVHQNYQEMFEKENLNIVDIATPIDTHSDIAISAAQRGIHVLCQKPFARTMDEAKSIIAACSRSKVKLMVHQNFRYQPFPQLLKNMIEKNELGQIFYCRIFHRVLFSPDKLPIAARGSEEITMNHVPHYLTNKHLVLLNMAIHNLDTARFLLGEPIRIYVNTRQVNPNSSGEDHVLCLLEYQHTVCYIEESWVTRAEEQIGFRLEGTNGTIEIMNEDFHHWKTDGAYERRSLSEMFPGVTMKTLDNYSFKLVQQHFVDCILNDKIPQTSGEDNLKTLNLVFKGYESARTHQIIELNEER
jgi:predicted dehydrogenase